RNLSQIPRLADINFASSSRPLAQARMWETNTSAASFHARLNVAPQAVDTIAASPPHLRRRYNLSQIPQHGGRLLVEGEQRAGKSEPDRDEEGGGHHAGGAAGLPDEAQGHQPGHDQPGRDGAC